MTYGQDVAPDTRLDPEKEQEVLRLYKEGVKVEQIVDETDTPRSTVYWILKKHRVTPKRQRPPGQSAIEHRLDGIEARLEGLENQVALGLRLLAAALGADEDEIREVRNRILHRLVE